MYLSGAQLSTQVVPWNDIPVPTVSLDPFATTPSNIPGLVMQAPDVLVGEAPADTSAFPTWIILLGVVLLLAHSSKRR